jgi:hypothetical protein
LKFMNDKIDNEESLSCLQKIFEKYLQIKIKKTFIGEDSISEYLNMYTVRSKDLIYHSKKLVSMKEIKNKMILASIFFKWRNQVFAKVFTDHANIIQKYVKYGLNMLRVRELLSIICMRYSSDTDTIRSVYFNKWRYTAFLIKGNMLKNTLIEKAKIIQKFVRDGKGQRRFLLFKRNLFRHIISQIHKQRLRFLFIYMFTILRSRLKENFITFFRRMRRLDRLKQKQRNFYAAKIQAWYTIFKKRRQSRKILIQKVKEIYGEYNLKRDNINEYFRLFFIRYLNSRTASDFRILQKTITFNRRFAKKH